MEHADYELLAGQPVWQRLLLDYLEMTSQQAESSEEMPSGPRWAGRIVALDDLEPAELSQIHGKMIAQGWLLFQMENGEGGLTYRVSPEGRRLLQRIRTGQSAHIDSGDAGEESQAGSQAA
jgi:hypothetical protein